MPDGSVRVSGRQLWLHGPWTPEVRYTVQLSSGVVDVFGQFLGDETVERNVHRVEAR